METLGHLKICFIATKERIEFDAKQDLLTKMTAHGGLSKIQLDGKEQNLLVLLGKKVSKD